MKKLSLLVTMAMSLNIIACATPYQKSGFSGGYDEEKINQRLYKVAFYGNGYTTKETVQTYWLYRAAEVTLEKGYDYFEITNTLMSHLEMERDGLEPQTVAYVVYIPMDSVRKPEMIREIRLHRSPYRPRPPKSFNARKLKKILEPYVKGKKCKKQVCPHEKKYLESPKGVLG